MFIQKWPIHLWCMANWQNREVLRELYFSFHNHKTIIAEEPNDHNSFLTQFLRWLNGWVIIYKLVVPVYLRTLHSGGCRTQRSHETSSSSLNPSAMSPLLAGPLCRGGRDRGSRIATPRALRIALHSLRKVPTARSVGLFERQIERALSLVLFFHYSI